MNNNFDFASKKSLLILFLICMVFLLLIAKAFDYIPEESNSLTNEEVLNINNAITQKNMNQNSEQPEASQPDNVSEQTSSSENETETQPAVEKTEQTVEVNAQEANKVKTPTEGLIPIDENISKDTKLPDIENVQNTEKSELDSVQQNLSKAEELKKLGEYDAALDAYRTITLGVSTASTTAKCYEEMANIYAIQKKYGSAIVYAQKANKVEKTPAREKLIQSLIQKAGMQTSIKK